MALHSVTKLQLACPFCDERETVSAFWLVWTVLLWCVPVCARFAGWVPSGGLRIHLTEWTFSAQQIQPHRSPTWLCWLASPPAVSEHSWGFVPSPRGHPEGCTCVSLRFYWLVFPCGLVDVSLIAFHSIISLLCVLFVKCPFKSLILFFPCWFVVLYVFWVCILCRIHVS